MKPWLQVIGIGEQGLDELGQSARELIEKADVLVGGARHLAMLRDGPQERLQWPKPFHPLLEEISNRSGQSVVVLASGDPSFHGVAKKYVEAYGCAAVNIVPSPSAFSLAAARMGWALEEVETISLHGHPYERLHLFVQPNTKLLVLTDRHASPARIAKTLCSLGYPQSNLAVLEHLGGKQERITQAKACDWQLEEVASLNTVAIDCLLDCDIHATPRLAGLPDDSFEHDGQMTKREVRAATISQLAPNRGQCLWDVGAGCGSIAIEWLRSAHLGSAFAVEDKPTRCRMIKTNARTLGVPELTVIEGRAPQALESLPAPDAVFIGGGVNGDCVLETCWQALRPGGRLVANVVSLEGQRKLFEWHERIGGEMTQYAIARATSVGRFHAWKPMMPVTQLATTKPPSGIA